MSAYLERAIVLVQQSRFREAREQLQRAIGENPESPRVHALLAMCLQETGETAEAKATSERAIAQEPDDPYPHYVRGWILAAQDQPRRALESVREALRLDPQDPDHHALLSRIHLRLSEFQKALDAAEAGLEIDAEHVGCVNLRAMALTHLGQKEAAAAGIETALARDPEVAATHANRGWAALHAGDYPRALESFREALRLDPESEWAREGMIEAIKGKSIVYRPIHRFLLWTQRLGTAQSILVVIAFPIANRVLRTIRDSHPDLTPVIEPIIYALLFFVYLTWTAEPLSDAVLFSHRYGRVLLSGGRKIVGALSGLMMLGGVALLVGWYSLSAPLLLLLGIVSLAMVIPLHGTATLPPGGLRIALWVGTGVLGLLGAAILVIPGLYPLFILGVVGYTWLRIAIAARHKMGR